MTSTVEAYRRSMIDFAGQPTLAVWYARAELQSGLPNLKKMLPKAARSATRAVVNKSLTRDHTQALTKVTEVHEGQRRFLSRPPILVPIRDLAGQRADELEAWLEGLLPLYRESLPSDRRVLLDSFRLVDMARKVVGVGSVGTRAWLLLLLDDAGEPLLLQAKEAGPSVLAAHLPGPAVDHQGRRVVEGQRLMQASSDHMLGWQRTEGVDGVSRDFYVRQFHDWKGGYDVEGLDVDTLGMLATMCAWTLARAHARSGDRATIAAYLGTTDEFDRAMAEFAVAYADKNDRDHASLAEAARSGRVPVVHGL